MMIRMLQALFLVLAAAFMTSAPAIACETIKPIATEQLKQLRDALLDAKSDPFDKLFAFESLSCADNPTIRAFAIKAGLEKSSDALLRQQVLLEALMQKARVDIQLTENDKSTSGDKQFIRENAGVWSRPVVYHNAQQGCLSTYTKDACTTYGQLVVKGDLVELTAQNLIGSFRLTDQNELVGYVRAAESASFGRIPAVIKLF